MPSLSKYSTNRLAKRVVSIKNRITHNPRWDADNCTQCRVAERIEREIDRRLFKNCPDDDIGA
jgi:hypothetical protein